MKRIVAALVLLGVVITSAAQGRAQNERANCRRIHADMREARTTTGCRPGHAFCFIGEIDGNHGLRGTTYFKGDSGTGPIPTSPEFVGYSGLFEYTTERGSLVARESGVTSQTQRVVTAYQKIIGATGEYAGATGYFFVSGQNDGQQVVTTVAGEICYP